MTRVLVVEDEESFSDALSYMLEREGYDAVVATNHGGSVSVWSEEGLGSTFTLRIPLAAAAPEPAGDAPAEHDLAGGPPAADAPEGRS